MNPILQAFAANAQTAAETLISSDSIRAAATDEVQSGRFQNMENQMLQADMANEVSAPSVPNGSGSNRSR